MDGARCALGSSPRPRVPSSEEMSWTPGRVRSYLACGRALARLSDGEGAAPACGDPGGRRGRLQSSGPQRRDRHAYGAAGASRRPDRAAGRAARGADRQAHGRRPARRIPERGQAVMGAIEIQRAMAERNAGVPEGRRIQYRIGINIGDIVVEGQDILGDGVNVAARLQGLAPRIWHLHRGERARRAAGKLDLACEQSGRAAPQEHRQADPRLSDPARPDRLSTLRRAAMRPCRTGPRSSSCPSSI